MRRASNACALDEYISQHPSRTNRRFISSIRVEERKWRISVLNRFQSLHNYCCGFVWRKADEWVFVFWNTWFRPVFVCGFVRECQVVKCISRRTKRKLYTVCKCCACYFPFFLSFLAFSSAIFFEPHTHFYRASMRARMHRQLHVKLLNSWTESTVSLRIKLDSRVQWLHCWSRAINDKPSRAINQIRSNQFYRFNL